LLSHRAEFCTLHNHGVKGPARHALIPVQPANNIKDMHPGPNIKALRLEREWKLDDLAEAVERHLGRPVNTGNLSRLERQKQGYSDELINAIARAFRVDVARLFERHKSADIAVSEPRDPPQEGIEAGQIVSSVTYGGLTVATYSVPILEIGASMGVGQVQPEYETIIGRVALNRHWVHTRLPNVTSPRNIRIITGYGDSMAGTHEDGDPLFVDIGVTDVRVDAVYVFAMNDELYVKRLQRRPDGAITVISDNPKYPPYAIGDRERVRVIGRVVGAWNWRKL